MSNGLPPIINQAYARDIASKNRKSKGISSEAPNSISCKFSSRGFDSTCSQQSSTPRQRTEPVFKPARLGLLGEGLQSAPPGNFMSIPPED